MFIEAAAKRSMAMTTAVSLASTVGCVVLPTREPIDEQTN
jgi:hypothetical protein